MRWTTVAFVAAALLSVAAGKSWSQPSSINFDVPGPADWNVAGNWITPGGVSFIPGDDFPAEVVGISNGGIAELTSMALFPVSGLVLGETGMAPEDGTLNISGAGGLQLVDAFGEGNAALRIGDAGRGVLNQSGGTVQADSLSVGGAADSALNLSGSAIVSVASANLNRITTIEGSAVVFAVEGDVRVGGTFVPVITGPTHSAISADGNANVGGTLRPEFDGHTPVLGDSWTLISAASVVGSFTIDDSQAPATPRGTVFEIVVQDEGGVQNLNIEFANRLVLTVNRTTGATSLENAIGADIEFDGYTIASPNGRLTGAWSSLESDAVGDWVEANPSADRVSELNPTGSSTLMAGQSLNLGTPYQFSPTAIGESAEEDITFVYSSPSGVTLSGIVEFVGNHNNMVLFVDPTTGAAAFQNQSSFTAPVDGYIIGSPSGSLLPDDGAWLSLGDQGIDAWDEANPTVNNLNELNPSGSSVFNTNDLIGIGSPFSVGGEQDLTLEFTLTTGEIITGIVEYGMIPDQQQCIVGDTSPCDQVVNIDDLNRVRNSFGTGDGSDLGGIAGDAWPFDGFVNIDDLNGVRNTFGNTAAPAAVPEPTTWILLGLGGFLALVRPRHQPAVTG